MLRVLWAMPMAGHLRRPQAMPQRPATARAAPPATASTLDMPSLQQRTAPVRTALATMQASRWATTPPAMQMRRAEAHRYEPPSPSRAT